MSMFTLLYPILNKTMTLHFSTLEQFGQFIKAVSGGYYANVANLTIKGNFQPEELDLAQRAFNAELHTHNAGTYVAANGGA